MPPWIDRARQEDSEGVHERAVAPVVDTGAGRSRRRAPLSTRRPTRLTASLVGASTRASQSRSTSEERPRAGRRRSSRRPVLATRLTKWMAPGFRGLRPGTAMVSRHGYLRRQTERKSRAPTGGASTWAADDLVGEAIGRWGSHAQAGRRSRASRALAGTRRSSPASTSRESVFATASGTASKSSGRQKRSHRRDDSITHHHCHARLIHDGHSIRSVGKAVHEPDISLPYLEESKGRQGA